MQSDSHREAVAGRVCSASPRASSPAESRAIFCSSTQQTQLIFANRLDMKNTWESRQCARSFQCLENNAKQREKILNSATIFVLEIHFFFLHECKGGKELEWQKLQPKENHFPRAMFRFWKNLAHASGIVNGIVLTWKL